MVRISSFSPSASPCSSVALKLQRNATTLPGWSHTWCAGSPFRLCFLTALNGDQEGFSKRKCISICFTGLHNPAASAVLLSMILIVKLWLGFARVLFLMWYRLCVRMCVHVFIKTPLEIIEQLHWLMSPTFLLTNFYFARHQCIYCDELVSDF